MKIALLIYVINTLPNIATVLGLLSAVCIIMLVFGVFYWIGFSAGLSKEHTIIMSKHMKILTIIFISLLTIKSFIPSERTSYLMLGGYVAQTIAESNKMGVFVEETDKISSKLSAIINKKLDSYTEELNGNKQ
jgi:hypothetical protein